MSESPPNAALSALEHASVGAPITRLGVSLFPVYLNQPAGVPVLIGEPGSVRIDEAEAESVPTVSVTSLSHDPVLLVEGDVLAGGMQQRILNVSVLVAPGATLEVPVSCVEVGRWGGSRSFSGVTGQASRRVRRAKHEGVERNLRAGRARHSDQDAVWASVDAELRRLERSAPTGNLSDSDAVFHENAHLAGAVEELVALGPLRGQCGVVVSHGSRVVAADVLATQELLRARWSSMVRAAMLDSPSQVRGRPSASRALRLIRNTASGSATEVEGVGLGREHHVRTRSVVAHVLTWEDLVVHTSSFVLAA